MGTQTGEGIRTFVDTFYEHVMCIIRNFDIFLALLRNSNIMVILVEFETHLEICVKMTKFSGSIYFEKRLSSRYYVNRSRYSTFLTLII